MSDEPGVSDEPNVSDEHFDLPDMGKLSPRAPSTHPPRILLLYGSLRERSFSRLCVEEAARLLGLHRSNLYRKMRQLDMEESQSLRDQQ